MQYETSKREIYLVDDNVLTNKMGIAKSIEGYGVFDKYNRDVDSFLKTLSDVLDSNFVLNSFDKDYNSIHEENKYIDFHRKNEYQITIEICEYEIQNSKEEFPIYELTIPIDYIYEDSLTLIFYPNNCVHIMFLTFEHLWRVFIDNLKLISDFNINRQLIINRYEKLRQAYIPYLLALNINSILITTHAYYQIENLTDIEEYCNLTFPEIIKSANEKDNLQLPPATVFLHDRRVVRRPRVRSPLGEWL